MAQIPKRNPPTRPSTGVDRGRYGQALMKRTREAFERKDSSGKYGSYIKDEYQQKQWNCVENEHIIDVIPYLAGSNHPHLEEGEIGLLLDVYRHGNVGPNEDNYVCLSRTFNQPCPICEDQREKRKSGEYSDDDLKVLNPSRRSIYNVWVHDNEKEEAKGVQLWEVAQWFFDKHVSARAKSARTGEYINYADPETGKSIQFERKGKGRQNTEFLAHTFIDREYAIPDEVLAQAIPLDQVITIPSYDDVYRAYFGQDNKKEKVVEEEQPAPPRQLNRPLRTPAPAAPPPTQAEEQAPECPAGGTFGVDIDNLAECVECAIYDDCNALYGELEAQQPPPPPPVNKPKPLPLARPPLTKPKATIAPPNRLRRPVNPKVEEEDIPF